MVYVRQCFHAVGHGTFFSGLAIDELTGDSFSWVYDCGSKRKKRIDESLKVLDGFGAWPREVDLLVLSHFDDDHVNGVEQLLKYRKVRVLALPYMDVGHKLACLASVCADPCSASVAAFQIDPIGWLKSRGLSEQVDTVLLVQGGPRGDDDPAVDGEPVPLPTGPDDNQMGEGRSESSVMSSLLRLGSAIGKNSSSSPHLAILKHFESAVAYGLPLELVFFNATQPSLFLKDKCGDLVARRSRCSISAVQVEVDFNMRIHGLDDLSGPPKRKWREALRQVYVKHFGSSSQQRNNISLCLLVRPAKRINTRPFNVVWRGMHYGLTDVSNRAGTLLLGDLRIDSSTLAEMKAHFGTTRWAELGVVQVPHHGSQHSWMPGAATAFGSDLFVHCVPDTSFQHPHRSVDADLGKKVVLRADYREVVLMELFLIDGFRCWGS